MPPASSAGGAVDATRARVSARAVRAPSSRRASCSLAADALREQYEPGEVLGDGVVDLAREALALARYARVHAESGELGLCRLQLVEQAGAFCAAFADVRHPQSESDAEGEGEYLDDYRLKQRTLVCAKGDVQRDSVERGDEYVDGYRCAQRPKRRPHDRVDDDLQGRVRRRAEDGERADQHAQRNDEDGGSR